jgi:hypothetical protein
MKKILLVLIVVVTISTLFSSCGIMLDALADACYIGRYYDYGYEHYPVYYHRQQSGYREYYYYDQRYHRECRVPHQRGGYGNHF